MIRNFFYSIKNSNEKKILIENFSSLSLLQFINYLLPLITFPYLVRVLGTEQFGLISFAQSFINYFIIITDYGFNYSANRDVAIHRNNLQKISSIFSSVMTVKFIFFIASFMFFSLLTCFIPKVQASLSLYYFYFLLVLGNLLFPSWFFQGMEKMKFVTLLNVIAKIIFTFCIFIFVKKPQDFIRVPLLSGLGYIVAGLIGLTLVYRYFKVKFTIPSISEIYEQAKHGWDVFVATIAISFYSNTRIFVIGLLTNNTLTGYYAIAEKLADIIQSSFIIPLAQTFYPRLSNIYSNNPRESFRIMEKVQRFVVWLYLLILPFMYFMAPFMIKLIGKTAYPETLFVFRLLLIAIFIASANAFRVQFLLVAGFKKLFARLHLFAGALGIILTVAFTYKFTYLGPAFAFILVEIVVLVLTLRAMAGVKNKL